MPELESFLGNTASIEGGGYGVSVSSSVGYASRNAEQSVSVVRYGSKLSSSRGIRFASSLKLLCLQRKAFWREASLMNLSAGKGHAM